MIPFRERNPVVIGGVGLTTIALLIAAAFNIESLPVIGSGDQYTAAFSEAGGLKGGDEVRIAGVKVGKVDDVALQGDHVKVTFRIKGEPRFGTRTRAAIRVKTILGAKYMALQPEGHGQLEPGSEIPVNRTTPAYDVVQAFSDLTTNSEKIDTTQLAKSFDTISETFKNSPKEVKDSLDGMSRLSRTVASRDEALRSLVKRTNGVTGVLSGRSKQLITLMKDGNKLFDEVQRRRQAIHALLVNSTEMATQLSGLVDDNRKQIGPALSRLNQVVQMLKRNEDSLNRSVKLMAPFARVFTNTLGNGRWFDTYIQNLVSAPPTTPQTNSSAQIPSGGSQ